MRIVVLASGRGSNFEAIASAVRDNVVPRSTVVGLLSNNPQALALTVAKTFDVPSSVIDASDYRAHGKFDRTGYEKELLLEMDAYRPDLVCLAGYMLVLGKTIIRSYPGRIVNIHPSLLPSFRGLHAQRQAIEAGVQWTGCTVHWVTEELDSGSIIAQSVLRVERSDTEESLSKRLLAVEHETYVRALREIALSMQGVSGAPVF